MHRGIFFKLAVDNNSIYGGDVWAMKTALHERKGLLNVMVKYSSSSVVAISIRYTSSIYKTSILQIGFEDYNSILYSIHSFLRFVCIPTYMGTTLPCYHYSY